jgi:hypothetical protein
MNLTLTQFPIFAAALATATPYSKRDYTPQVEQALKALADGIEADAIANVVYKDTVKFYIGRAIEHAWDIVVREPFFHAGKWETLTADEQKLDHALNTPQAHTIGGMIKKINKAKIDTDYTRAALALLTEIAPIGEAIVSLKDKIVKRQPKPVEDRKAKYDAPRAGKEAIFAVKAILIEVTTEAYADLIKKIDGGLKTRLTATLALAADIKAAAGDIQKARRAGQVFRQFAGQDPFVYQLIDRNNERNDNADELIAAEAIKRADTIREHFVYKNLEKIDSILEAKGDFDAITIIGRSVSLGGLEGSFLLTFKDGARFEVTNSVVYSVSIHGKGFLRFPLTFHNVVFGNGTRMKQPSEEKMNTEFVGRETWEFEGDAEASA